jgi:hypothetical protein
LRAGEGKEASNGDWEGTGRDDGEKKKVNVVYSGFSNPKKERYR